MRYSAIFFALGVSAQAADLNIYTYDSFTSEWGPGPAIEQGFEGQCGCDIEFITAGDGAAMLTRLRIEGDKTDADIALGLDQNLVPQAEALGIFAPHDLGAQNINGAELSWDHPNFRAYDWGQFAFVYDRAKWQENELEDVPASLEALAESEISVILESPSSSTPGLGMALWVYDVYGDKAQDFWKRMKDNVVTITPGWSEAYSLFLEGEAKMVLSYSTSPAYHRIAEENMDYYAAAFDEGHALQIELAGILKTSRKKPLAREFLQYLSQDEAQNALLGANWMYPVADVALPDGFDAPEGFSSLMIEVDETRIQAAIEAFETGLR